MVKHTLKYALLLAAITFKGLLGAGLDSCDCGDTGKSHLAVRPLFASHSPIQRSAFRQDRMHEHDKQHAAIQFVAYGSKSTNEDELARYFMPFCKKQLIVASGATAFNGDADVGPQSVDADLLARNFNIFTQNGQFHSLICFKPKQSVFGFAMHAAKSFWRNEETNRGFWASATLPIEHVKNSMGLRETVINDGNGINETQDENVVANMKDAFNQKEWNHCKIPCGTISETGISDLELKLGYQWLDEDPCYLESYFGIVAPTGKLGSNRFMWAPQVGNGKHFGVMFGGAFSAQIWYSEDSDTRLRMDVATNTQYLFSKIHCRCFDLKCKPWSRFLEFYANEEQATQALNAANPLRSNLATPGVNLLNLAARVTPGFSHNTTTAFILNRDQFQGEIGYNLYCRQGECVRLAKDFQSGPAIKALNGLGGTNPDRDITANRRLNLNTLGVVLAQYDNSLITEDDIDMTSAATPCGVSHTMYASIGWRCDEREYPMFMNIGILYERGKATNGMIDRWAGWAKAGWSF